MTTNTFQGFTAPTQHTQTPNEFFDIIADPKTTIKEIRILALMIRNTFGWHRPGSSLQFSLTELEKMTGMHRETVSSGLKTCVSKGYLQKKTINGSNYYRLNILDFQDIPWEQSFDWKKYNQDKLSKPLSRQSENPTSRKIRPEVVGKSDQSQSENPTTLEAELLEPQEIKDSLNKDLKKFKEIEEEEELITVITESDVTTLMLSKIQERGITNEKTITAILKVASKCNQIGGTDLEALDNYVIKVVEDKMGKLGQKQSVKQAKQKSGRKEQLPEWFGKDQQQPTIEQSQSDTTALEEERRLLKEEFKQYQKA